MKRKYLPVGLLYLLILLNYVYHSLSVYICLCGYVFMHVAMCVFMHAY